MRCLGFSDDGKTWVQCQRESSEELGGIPYCAGHAEAIRDDVLAATAKLVYFVERDGLIKIGVSGNLNRRLVFLKARLLATEPGGYERESRLHARYVEHRVYGEWFKPAAELVGYIRSLPSFTGGLLAEAEPIG